MNETDLLTINEAKQLLRISSSTFYRYVKDGKLPAIKMGGKTSPWKVNRSDLNKILEGKH